MFQFDRKKGYFDFDKFTYDASNKRTRTIEEVREGSQKEYFDILSLHNIVSRSFMRGSRGGGAGGPNPPTLKNHKNLY